MDDNIFIFMHCIKMKTKKKNDKKLNDKLEKRIT